MNGLRTIVAVLGFALCGATAAQGTWPAKPIHMIVPFPPGSSPDLVARMINDRLGAALGQPVVIENKPGAGGMVGTGQVAKAAPDGYTFGVSIPGPLAVNTVLMKNMEYDPFRELAPVTVVAASPNVLVVDAKLGANTLREFIALAKSQPGKLNFGSVGNGSASHLTMELLKQRAGIDLVHVPYPGSPQVNTAILNGQIAGGFVVPGDRDAARAGRAAQGARRDHDDAQRRAARRADRRRAGLPRVRVDRLDRDGRAGEDRAADREPRRRGVGEDHPLRRRAAAADPDLFPAGGHRARGAARS